MNTITNSVKNEEKSNCFFVVNQLIGKHCNLNTRQDYQLFYKYKGNNLLGRGTPILSINNSKKNQLYDEECKERERLINSESRHELYNDDKSRIGIFSNKLISSMMKNYINQKEFKIKFNNCIKNYSNMKKLIYNSLKLKNEKNVGKKGLAKKNLVEEQKENYLNLEIEGRTNRRGNTSFGNYKDSFENHSTNSCINSQKHYRKKINGKKIINMLGQRIFSKMMKSKQHTSLLAHIKERNSINRNYPMKINGNSISIIKVIMISFPIHLILLILLEIMGNYLTSILLIQNLLETRF